MRFLTNKWIHILLLLALLGGALYVRVQDHDWTKSLRFIAFDSFNKIKPRPQTDDVVIVDIDESSMAHPELGQWPWSRDDVARMVDNLTAMGAKAIVFDMVFPEYDRTSPRALADRLKDSPEAHELGQAVAALPDNDAVLAESMKKSARAVTGFIWSGDERATRRKPVLSKPILMAKQAQPLAENIRAMGGVVTNIPEIEKAASGNGNFGVSPEIDGIIRRVPFLFIFEETLTGKELRTVYPSLAIEGLRVSQGEKTTIKIRALKPEEAGAVEPPLKMAVGNYEVPLDWDGSFYVYFSEERSDQYISAYKTIDGSVNPADIKDKIVFIGTSAEGLKDIRSTPLNLFIPGVEVHVNVVEQILTQDFLIRPKLIDGTETIFTGVVGLLIIVLAPFIGAVFMAAFVSALIAAVSYASWYAFDVYGLLLDPVYPGLCLLCLFVISSLLTYIRTEAERRQVRQAFGLYISPDFMKELTENPEKLKLGGETRDLTVMFTDIRNFTTISESLSPAALIQLMNDFLTPMSDLVMSNRGTIDKYMGDAMMAFWNAPLDDDEHALHACRTALRMNKALVPVNEEIRVQAEAERRPVIQLKAGIGINSGPASVGNMGSRQRFAYSALGDTVNLASRLEGQTKAYGVSIMASENTISQASGLATLELDLIRVKGKMEPVRIFTLVGEEEDAQTAEYAKLLRLHGDMLAAYRGMEWKDALDLAGQCRTLPGHDVPDYYAMMITRIQELIKTSPAKDWDGVYVATSK